VWSPLWPRVLACVKHAWVHDVVQALVFGVRTHPCVRVVLWMCVRVAVKGPCGMNLGVLQVVAVGGHTASREEALLYLLYRYAQGVSLLLCQQHFHRHESTISRIIQHVELHIHKHAAQVLAGFHPLLVSRDSLTLYRDAIAAHGCPIPNVFGFLDGCKWETTR
jgi:hypothetical protein